MNTFAPVLDSIERHPQQLELIEDYALILDRYDIPYRPSTYYLQVGDIEGTQGWLLHLSIVRSQIPTALQAVLPNLCESGVAFKIPDNKETARAILDGDLGNHIVGKVVTIYPRTASQAFSLAEYLIALTQPFNGPYILTDIHLGGQVYTRFGGFNPVIQHGEGGKEVKYIFDAKGMLVRDHYPIPFQYPDGVDWPFASIKPYRPQPLKKILHGAYKPIVVLKPDVKGNVFKALRISNYLRITWCIIKEARKSMWSDDLGRDMVARLAWQYELHQILKKYIPLPKVYDYFQEDDNMYLAMERLHGPSLFDKIASLYKSGSAWPYQSRPIQQQVVHYIMRLLGTVQQFHQHHIVHRDVTPVNFIVGKRGRLWPIDLELAYSLAEKRPYPAFEVGTHGFMSPQQAAKIDPTIKDDVFSLGATMISLFTGFSPLSFDLAQPVHLRHSLRFFIGNELIADLITRCLSFDPEARPTVQEIQTNVSDYQRQISQSPAPSHTARESLQVIETARRSIQGLCCPPTVISGDLWYTRARSFDTTEGGQQYTYEKNPGLADGIAGVLYVLAIAKTAGVDISPCMIMYKAGWAYLFDYQAKNPEAPLPTGLYGGTAGLALSLSFGLTAGLISDNEDHRARLAEWLLANHSRPDLAFGSAGLGVAILRCANYLPERFFQQALDETVRALLNSHGKNETWVTAKLDHRHFRPSLQFATGNSGIIWFLLEYSHQFGDQTAQRSALGTLEVLCRQVKPLIKNVRSHGPRSLFALNATIEDGFIGLVATLLKAYEHIGSNQYVQLADQLLRAIPPNVIHENLTSEFGLAGLGELYLEASRVTGNKEWQNRADWIAQMLCTLAHRSTEDTRYWLCNNQLLPTAYLLTGNSGIAHFLLRREFPDRIGYPIVS